MLQPTTPDATCRQCGKGFLRLRSFQVVCGVSCAKKAAQGVKKEASRAVRVRREKLKTVRDWIKEAQIEFNRYIRIRDRLAGRDCISSGRTLDWTGNGVDAGHFRSVGAAPQLRFNPDNCHAQSKRENQYLAGNAVAYRARLVDRIGLARVLALEANNTPHKWTIDELRDIKAEFRAKTKELQTRVNHDTP